MNKIVNKILPSRAKIAFKTTWIYLSCLWSTHQKKKKELKNLCRQGIQILLQK